MSDPGYEPTQVDLPAVQPGPGGTPPPPQGPTRPPGGPPPPGDDRRAWIIGGLVAVIVLVILALLLLRGDDRDQDDVGLDTLPQQSTTSSTSTSSTSSTTSSTSTSTTAPPATTTSTTNAPPVTADPDQCREAGADPLSPEPAAEAVFVAWTRSDVACARELMTDDALDELFSRNGAGATDVFQGCSEVLDPEPAMDCAFTYEGGSTHYVMNFSPLDGWQVFDVYQVAD